MLYGKRAFPNSNLFRSGFEPMKDKLASLKETSTVIEKNNRI